MKVIGTYLSKSSRDINGLNILVWPDSAVIYSRKPVFLPEGEDRHIVMTGVAGRIKNVGKTIGKKFASRYYDEIAPIAFILRDNVGEKISQKEDPLACEIVADCSVICGDFITVPKDFDIKDLKIEIQIKSLESNRNGIFKDIQSNFVLSDPKDSINKSIESASCKNTLKTGDIIGFILSSPYNARPETLLTICINGETLLENKFK